MTVQCERLMYALMLRQFHAGSEPLRAAYQRLETALAGARDKLPSTVILDWVETELVSLNRDGHDQGYVGSLLLKEAVALAKLAKS